MTYGAARSDKKTPPVYRSNVEVEDSNYSASAALVSSEQLWLPPLNIGCATVDISRL